MHLITRICALFLWMHTLAFVKSQDCTLEQFLSSDLYDSNFDTTSLEARYSGGKQVRVSCNVGYSGFFKLICVEGKWQSRGTKCQPRSCGHPGDAQFADFHLDKGDDFVFGSQVLYTCHKGYQMVSRTNYRRCMAEGWDGVVPVCEAQQCPVIYVDKNVQVNGDPEEATYGNVVRFSCKNNHEIMVGSPEIYCDESGRWSDDAPKCKEIKCAPPVIANGDVRGDAQEYSENELLNFACKHGYQATERRSSKCTKVGSRAEWSPTPACELITCKLRLPALRGTTYEPASKSVFLPGETLEVSCENSYWIFEAQYTSTVTTCRNDGEWSVRPVCQEVRCSNQKGQHVRQWDIYPYATVRLGDTTRYWCRQGYKRTDGTNLATCTRDGWRPNPFCQEITCSRLDIPNASNTNAYKQTYKQYDLAEYTCNEGYTGRPTRRCEESGWSGNSQCTEVTCRRQYYENADIEGNAQHTYRYKEQVTYVCKNGYEGSFTLSCGKTGWTGSSQCISKRCEKLLIDSAFIVGNVKDVYRHNERVQYACTNNDDHRFTVTCENRKWTGIQSCTACPKAEVPNGFVVGPYNDTLYYTCNEGYKLFTKGWWAVAKCNDRVWSGLDQCIEKSKCGEIPAIPKGKTTAQHRVYGQDETIQVICKGGYEAQIDSLSCHEGKWHSEGLSLKTICTPIADHCSPPPKVENAVVVTSYEKEYLSDSEVAYQCREKYTMEGENTLRCQNGKWEKKNITCTPYCDKLKDETQTMIFTATEERYINGDVIHYQCVTRGEQTKGTATCVNGKWDKTLDCEAPAQEQ